MFKIVSTKYNKLLFTQLIIDKKDFNNINSINLINLIYDWLCTIINNNSVYIKVFKEISIEKSNNVNNESLTIELGEPYSATIDYKKEDIVEISIYKLNYKYSLVKYK